MIVHLSPVSGSMKPWANSKSPWNSVETFEIMKIEVHGGLQDGLSHQNGYLMGRKRGHG